MQTHGIDVSTHNGNINWATVKASGKVDFVILRAGYGRYASQVDTKFRVNYDGCVNNNIPVGVYWYSYAHTVDEARMEANACLEVLNGRKLQYPVYFDFEEKSQLNTGRANVSAMAKAFCETIEAAGYYAGLYSMKSGLQSYMSDEMKNRYTVWVAHINVSSTSYTGHDMWQYTWTARIPGISGDVDCSYCYKDFPSIIGGNTPTPTEPLKSIDEVAQEVLEGKWGNGAERRMRLTNAGYNYDAVQNKVNEILASQKPTTTPTENKKTASEIAEEVLDGKWGNGEERKKRLTEAGYNYDEVQAKVNEILASQAPKLQNYVVKRGDTLTKIAKQFGTTVDTILANNKKSHPKMTRNFIMVGWILRV